MLWVWLGIAVFAIGTIISIGYAIYEGDAFFFVGGTVLSLVLGLLIFILGGASTPEVLPENMTLIEEIELIPIKNSSFEEIGTPNNSKFILNEDAGLLPIYRYLNEDGYLKESTVNENLFNGSQRMYIFTSSEYEKPVIQKYKFNSTFWYSNIFGPDICFLILPSYEDVYEAYQ